MHRSSLIILGVLVVQSCARLTLAADAIDVLVKKLDSDMGWRRGTGPTIQLASNATPSEVIASAVKFSTFGKVETNHYIRAAQMSVSQIRSYKTSGIREVHLKGMPNCSAALIDSDLGKKILLFRYEENQKMSYWLTRFYDAPQEAESSLPANGVPLRR